MYRAGERILNTWSITKVEERYQGRCIVQGMYSSRHRFSWALIIETLLFQIHFSLEGRGMGRDYWNFCADLCLL
jgi:hypothetical protein